MKKASSENTQKEFRRANSTKFERGRTIQASLFLIPTLLLTSVFVVWPLIEVVYLSFFEWNGISVTKKFVGIQNYIDLPVQPGFWEMAGATVVYALGVTVLTIAISFIVALALDKKGKGRINRGLMRVIWFFPCLLSMVVIGILWRIMFNYSNGLINQIIEMFGGSKVNWLETLGVARWAVIVATVWSQIGMNVVIFLAGLQSIPGDLNEAASIDGATPMQQLWNITIPMMAPSITINVLTTTIAAFKMYELPLLVSNGGPGFHTTLLTKKIYDWALQSADFGHGSALSVVLIIIITVISLIQLVYLRKREDIY